MVCVSSCLLHLLLIFCSQLKPLDFGFWHPSGGIKRELAAAKKKVGLLLLSIVGLRYRLFLDFHWQFWQISDRRDREKKAFSRLFQPSGGSEKGDKVLFYYHAVIFLVTSVSLDLWICHESLPANTVEQKCWWFVLFSCRRISDPASLTFHSYSLVASQSF